MIFGGFVKLDRSILNWKWYGNANTMRVFIHLLLIANYEDREFEQMVIRRGQAAVSYARLADILKLSVQQVRTAIEHLKSTGEITCRGYSKFTLITVNNYDAYQSVNRQNSRQTTSHQQAEQQPDNNNVRNNKNYKGNTAQFTCKHLSTILLASFPSYFTKMLANTQSIDSAFCIV